METQTALVRTTTIPARSASAKQRYRVLMAEDDIHTQEFLARLLKGRGIEVTVVDNGFACVDLALEAWENEEPYDGILLDIQMPFLRGYDVVSSLREEGYNGVIIAMTGHSYLHDTAKAVNNGCNDLLVKPFSVGRFLSLLTKHLNRLNSDTAKPDNTDSEEDEDSSCQCYPEVVLGFLNRLPLTLDEIKRSYDAKDFKTLTSLAHRLIGAELMGYPALGQLARTIEEASQHGRKENLSILMTQLEEVGRFVLADKEHVESKVAKKH